MPNHNFLRPIINQFYRSILPILATTRQCIRTNELLFLVPTKSKRKRSMKKTLVVVNDHWKSQSRPINECGRRTHVDSRSTISSSSLIIWQCAVDDEIRAFSSILWWKWKLDPWNKLQLQMMGTVNFSSITFMRNFPANSETIASTFPCSSPLNKVFSTLRSTAMKVVLTSGKLNGGIIKTRRCSWNYPS